jgi:Protein of unknown function (DUF669)
VTTIDFQKVIQDAKSASNEPLPIGDYDVEIAEATATTSSNDRPMIKVVMKVLDGPHARRSLRTQFVMTLENPVALSIFFRHMKCFGLDEQFFLSGLNNLGPVAQALQGRRANVTVKHREWQGELQNEVSRIKPYTGAPKMVPSGPGGPVAPGATPSPTFSTKTVPPAVTTPSVPSPQPTFTQPPQTEVIAPTSSGLDEFAPTAPSVQPVPTPEAAAAASAPVPPPAPTAPELPY